MRRTKLYSLLILALTGTAVGGEAPVKTEKVVTQAVCTTGTCAQVPATYTVRQRFLVPTTVETTYEVKSQVVVQDEPVQAGVCRPRAQLRLPRLRLFGGSCCQ